MQRRFKRNPAATLDDYLVIAGNKTASLFSQAARIGAHFAGASAGGRRGDVPPRLRARPRLPDGRRPARRARSGGAHRQARGQRPARGRTRPADRARPAAARGARGVHGGAAERRGGRARPRGAARLAGDRRTCAGSPPSASAARATQIALLGPSAFRPRWPTWPRTCSRAPPEARAAARAPWRRLGRATIFRRRCPSIASSREIDYLRISLTDHCNLRCVYCMPLQGAAYAPLEGLADRGGDRARRARGGGVGFRKIRLTGGEPTLRPDLVDIVERIARVPGIRDVALTTNGILLPQPRAGAGRGRAAAREHPRRLARSRARRARHALGDARRHLGGHRGRVRGRPHAAQAQLRGRRAATTRTTSSTWRGSR